jgi:hypothetical protein
MIQLRSTLGVLILVWGATGACCGDSVDAVEFSLTFPGSADRDSLTVGDTATVWAGAIAGTDWPSCVLYVSRETSRYTWPVEPDRFAFQSSDTSVATFGPAGFLTARREGETLLTVTTQSVSRTLLLKVLTAPS